MRVAADHLLGNGFDYIVEVEVTGLLRHLRIENDLKHQIAEFVLQFRHIPLRNRLCNLIGFFDGVRRDRIEILLEIPRTTTVGVA